MTEAAAREASSTDLGAPQAHAGNPTVGSSVTIVPAGDARLLTGTLLSWTGGVELGTQDVQASVDIAPTSAQGGRIKVWATFSAGGGDVVVLTADACAGDSPHTLLLDGRVAAREPRRRTVRAAAHVPVDLALPGAERDMLSGRTLDLSAGGCRLSLEGEMAELDAGEPTDVVIHLDRYNRPRLSGRVHAVRPGGQVVIRFDDVPGRVAEQIERYVYATLP